MSGSKLCNKNNDTQQQMLSFVGKLTGKETLLGKKM
jgi:hypothetical protein